jgi:hypothetical protein
MVRFFREREFEDAFHADRHHIVRVIDQFAERNGIDPHIRVALGALGLDGARERRNGNVGDAGAGEI